MVYKISLHCKTYHKISLINYNPFCHYSLYILHPSVLTMRHSISTMSSTITLTISSTPCPSWSFYKVVDECNKFHGNVDNMWKFCILDNSTPVGYVLDDFVSQMYWRGTAFNVCRGTKTIHLNPSLAPGDDGTDPCNEQFIKLCEINHSRFGGCLEKWLPIRTCFHAIRWLDDPTPVFKIPTPLRGILGIATAGVHLNVYTIIDHEPFMWVSQRAHTTTYPGMLDQIVAGAMNPDDGTNFWNTLRHEALDEAGLELNVQTKKIFQNGVEVGIVEGPSRITFYDQKDQSAGIELGHLEPGVRFVFEMEVPADFVPKPGPDNAVAGFALQSVDEVKKDLLKGKWKPNSGLTTLDFLLRKGFIENSGDGTVESLCKALQRKLPMATK